MNEDLEKKILRDTILEYEKYSADTKLPFIFEEALKIKENYKKNEKKLNEISIPSVLIEEIRSVQNKQKQIKLKIENIKKEIQYFSRKNEKLRLLKKKSNSFFDLVFGVYNKEIRKCEEKEKELRKKIENKDKKDLLTTNQKIKHLEQQINKFKKTQEPILQLLETAQKEIESKIDIYKFLENSLNNYFDKNDKEVVAYCNLILKHSPYNANDGQSWLNLYNPETKNLIIDYNFPPVEIVSNIKEVRYLKTRDEYKDVYYSKTEFNKLYDNMLYQITLLTIYELFISDRANAIDSICFNGWLKSKNKATGHDVNNCILTIQVGKTELLELDLKYVDPKECFKKLKGIANSKLHSVIPVAPIISINREDERFIEPKNIQENIDESYNLAVMDWEDFEHLIREVFEKEFAKTGGEVKVTRSSRDKGVDAIAFDPDPIKGGKIVIQAKRYTNTVGVNAVRDLYGTILNEGANKGILVTTSDYGPDAFEFAKGKPITLLNGGNLLNLLARNGQKARIDIKEAKQLRLEKEKSLFTEDLF